MALSQYGTVAPSFVCHRIVMASSMIDGRTVMEAEPDHRASAEVVALWTYLDDRLVRLANRVAFHRQRPAARAFGRRSDDAVDLRFELAARGSRMTMARLTASLLAAKGTAFPIANAYANPLLDPLSMRREAPQRAHPRHDGSAHCRMAGELHARLRILAARQGRPLRAALEAAVADYLAAHGEHCPCLRSGARALDERDGAGGCCLGQR